jgi:glucose-1-phosphate adenylyltransferase
VFGADHIYRMDPVQMLEQHVASGAGVTVAGIRVPIQDADQFGVIQPGAGSAITAFHEKPPSAVGLADAPHQVFASMGNYIFTTEALLHALNEDASNLSSHHDMGGDIIPMLVRMGQAHVYDFADNQIPGATDRDRGYWRDVGTLDSYYEAHMDLVSVHPVFNLYNRQWPIYTASSQLPPAKFVFDEQDRKGHALDSIVSAGVIVSGGTVKRSVLSPGVVVESHALVDDSVILDDVVIGEGAIVRGAIIDKNVFVPPGARIGVDRTEDEARFTVSPNGVTAIGKGEKVI